MCRPVNHEYQLLDAPLIEEDASIAESSFSNTMLWKGAAAAVAVFAIFAALITKNPGYYALTFVCFVYFMIPSFMYEDIAEWFTVSAPPPVGKEAPNPAIISAGIVNKLCDDAFPALTTGSPATLIQTVVRLTA